MLKPDALDRHLVFQVMSYFGGKAITIRCFDLQTATAEKMEQHYAENIRNYGPDFRRKTLAMFENRQVIPVILTGSPGVVALVRQIVGATQPAKAAPGTIRGDLGLSDSYERSAAENRLVRNLIHASDSPEAAEREARIWLPEFIPA